MSTTIKRIALVAVAALSLGVISVAPSSATTNSDSLTLSAATAAQTTAETSTATSATVTLQYLSSQATDSMSVTASLVSGPSTSVALPKLALVETTSAIVKAAGSDITSLTASGAVVDSNVKALVRPYTGGDVAQIVKAKFRVYVGEASNAAPTVAGTYVVKITPAVSDGNGGTLNAAAQTVTITVTEDAGLATVASPSLTTSYLVSGEGTSPAVASTDDVVAAAKTIGTDQVATIVLTQANAAGKGLSSTPASKGESLTAVITGPGSIASGAVAASISKTGARAITVKNGDYVGVFADGSAGVATITFTNSAGTVIATESVTFFSTVVAKLTAVTKKAYVLAGGTATDGSSAAGPTNTNSRVFLINAFDADGRDMASGAGTITVKPTTATTDALIGAAGVCNYAAKTTTSAAGYYCSAPGVSATKFGKVNYTFTATLADGVTTVTTTADVTFADKEIAKFTITGPASAAVGEEVTLTFTATDKNGYPVADLSYEGANTNGRTLWDSVVYSNSAFAPFAVGETITTVSGVATKKLYVPATAGTVKATWTATGTNGVASGALAKTLTGLDTELAIVVSNPGVDAATDAANEAAQAASDATDAALAAADAADAATTKAQEAVDAVATLSAQVSKLITALKAQITTLTNLVIKIQKKVRA